MEPVGGYSKSIKTFLIVKETKINALFASSNRAAINQRIYASIFAGIKFPLSLKNQSNEKKWAFNMGSENLP